MDVTQRLGIIYYKLSICITALLLMVLEVFIYRLCNLRFLIGRFGILTNNNLDDYRLELSWKRFSDTYKGCVVRP